MNVMEFPNKHNESQKESAATAGFEGSEALEQYLFAVLKDGLLHKKFGANLTDRMARQEISANEVKSFNAKLVNVKTVSDLIQFAASMNHSFTDEEIAQARSMALEMFVSQGQPKPKRGN